MMEWVWPVLILLLFLAVAGWLRRSVRQDLEQARRDPALALLQNQVQAAGEQHIRQMTTLQETVHRFADQVAQNLNAARKGMDERLDGASRVIQTVSRQLGQLDESSKRIFEVGRDLSEVQQILRAPKLRGQLGELFLGELLAQILPTDHYRLQYGFRGGEIVDAVVVLKAGLVPVDAKFPLDNFRALAAAPSDEARRAARKAFLRDVKNHVDAIAAKYIRADEGTMDFALMYIPAENVYYEIIIKDEEATGESGVLTYALSRRVIPVSPNSFYAYLQTILLGLKGLRVEESAREIVNQIAGLRREFERFDEAFRLIGQHLENSSKKYEEAEKRLGRIENRLEKLQGLSGSASEEPARLPEPPAES